MRLNLALKSPLVVLLVALAFMGFMPVADAQTRTGRGGVNNDQLIEANCLASVTRLEATIRELEDFSRELLICNETAQAYDGVNCVDLAAVEHRWDNPSNPTQLEFLDDGRVVSTIPVIKGRAGADATCGNGTTPTAPTAPTGPDPTPDPTPDPDPVPVYHAGCFVDTMDWDRTSTDADCTSGVDSNCTQSNSITWSVGDTMGNDAWHSNHPVTIRWTGDCTGSSQWCTLDNVSNGRYNATVTVTYQGDQIYRRAISARKQVRTCDPNGNDPQPY